MRVIKVFFSVLGVLILLIGVVTLIVLLAQGSLSSLKYPEWARFENEMMDSYPGIERWPMQMWDLLFLFDTTWSIHLIGTLVRKYLREPETLS